MSIPPKAESRFKANSKKTFSWIEIFGVRLLPDQDAIVGGHSNILKSCHADSAANRSRSSLSQFGTRILLFQHAIETPVGVTGIFTGIVEWPVEQKMPLALRRLPIPRTSLPRYQCRMCAVLAEYTASYSVLASYQPPQARWDLGIASPASLSQVDSG